MVHIWNDNGRILTSNSKVRARNDWGITREPDMDVTEEEFLGNRCVARLGGDGRIVLGLTEGELRAERLLADRQEISEMKAELAASDYVAAKIAEGAATREEYADVLERRAELRARINGLEDKCRRIEAEIGGGEG